jgi:hypothetical protein
MSNAYAGQQDFGERCLGVRDLQQVFANPRLSGEQGCSEAPSLDIIKVAALNPYKVWCP